MVFLSFLPGLAPGAGIEVPARIRSVYDGDTVRVEAAMWPGLTWTGQRPCGRR